VSRVFKIIDSGGVIAGTAGISLIDPATIIGTRGGLNKPTLNLSQIEAGSIVEAEILEDLSVNLYGSSQDNASNQIQILVKMLRKAGQWWKAAWQSAPVYLQAQHTSETGARYALVKGAMGLSLPDVFDAPFEVDARLEVLGLSIVREHPWRSGVPGTLPVALTQTATDGPASPTLVHVVNFRDDVALTHLYSYDDSSTLFSANQISAASIAMWSVSGSTPAAADILYLGSTTAAWHHFVMQILTAGVFSADVIPEFWNGSAWAALTAGSQITLYPTGGEDEIFKSAGEWVLNVAPPSTWVANSINNVSAYWVRLRLNTVSSWTTTPVTHGTNTPYTPKTPHIELSSSIIKGDAPPRVLLRMFSPHGGTTTPMMGTTSRILMGIKSRGLSKFVANLNVGNAGNPGDWATAYGTDTAAADDVSAPRGKRANVTFATVSTLTVRVTLIGTALLDDWEGQYQAFAVARQVGGAAGDCAIRLRVMIGSSADGSPVFDTATVKLKSTGVNEWVELGIVKLPLTETVFSDALGTDLVLRLLAERSTGASTLGLVQLVLIPVDEWSVILDDPISFPTTGASALRGNTVLDLDGGILRNRTLKHVLTSGVLYPAEAWYRGGSPPQLEPGRQTRFYFLMGHYPTTFGTGPLLCTLGQHLAVSIYAHHSYNTLRGAD